MDNIIGTTDTTEGKVVFGEVRWRILRRASPRNQSVFGYEAIPTCRRCQVNMQEWHGADSHISFTCRNPQCDLFKRSYKFDGDSSSVHRLVIDLWEASKRVKEPGQWTNLDQELVRTTSGKAVDKDNEYWVDAKFFKAKRGKMLVIYVGKKGHDSKVQFFVKDGDDQVSFDQVGDANPKELFIGFKAYFSDGAVSETSYTDVR